MLPTLGYLRSINCPFYAKGLCERPYCHFRHVRKASDVIQSITKVLDEASSNNNNISSNPNLLKVVDDEIKKAEAQIIEEKEKLQNFCNTPSSNSKPVEETERKTCWLPANAPAYKPTPINKLRQTQHVDKQSSSEHCAAAQQTSGKVSYTPTKIVKENNGGNVDAVVNKSLSSYTLNVEYSDRCGSKTKSISGEPVNSLKNTSESSPINENGRVAENSESDNKTGVEESLDSVEGKPAKNAEIETCESKANNDDADSKTEKHKDSSGSKTEKHKDSSGSKTKDSKIQSDSKNTKRKHSKHSSHSKSAKHSSHKDSKHPSKHKDSKHSGSKNKKSSKRKDDLKIKDGKNSERSSSKKTTHKHSKHSSTRKSHSESSSNKDIKKKSNKSKKETRECAKTSASKNNGDSCQERISSLNEVKTADGIDVSAEKSESVVRNSTGTVKRRTAHQSEFLRKTKETCIRSNMSPAEVMHNRFLQIQTALDDAKHGERGLKNGKKNEAHIPSSMLAAVAAKKRKTDPCNIDGETTVTLTNKGCKRIAHQLSNSASIPRPRIPISYGSKVPCNIRQRYLNVFIDECLKIYPEQRDAYDRALEEESSAYSRSSNQTVYLNVVVNATKRLRDECKNSSTTNDTVAKKQLESTKKNGVQDKVETKNRKISHEYVLGGARATKVSFSIEKSNKKKSETLTDSLFYQLLKPHILNDEQLIENSFPRTHPDVEGAAIVHNIPEQKKLTSIEERLKKCSRCQATYHVDKYNNYVNDEQCIFHWGRLFKQRVDGEMVSSYSCCQSDRESDGCSVAKGHIDERINPNRLDGYVKTLPKDETDDEAKVYAIDCEMCCSAVGIELTRVTVINRNLQPIYETFVKPDKEIVDYNTRFSGITSEDLIGVTTSIKEVQLHLLKLFSDKSVLIGHSLNSDLMALKLIHNTVVDTSVVFPHRRGPPFKRALRNLMADYLMKIIQNDVAGHDSNEDARACMELMLWKIKEDMKKRS